MKRDPDLVRLLLLESESRSWDQLQCSVSLDGHTGEAIAYHLKLLSQAGYMECVDISSQDGPEWWIGPLTWQGHELLDAIRPPERFQEVKKTIRERVGAIGFEVLKELAVACAKAQLHLT